MGNWHKTGCVLCAQNCGLEVLVEDNRMVKARPDKDNPRSREYACRKGMNVAHYHHHADRLTHPLKRNPEWNSRRRACTLLMHPGDAEELDLKDGQPVRITTAAGQETVELEVSQTTRPGQVVMPHGFGLIYDGQVFGANVNRLTQATHRDRLAGTPLHRYVPCRVEAS
ncbi:MAG: molybdopterin dinucleotide binding domain-containing protein [Desulfosudaceae bacterium]